MPTNYPINLSREQFEAIRELLESVKKKPRQLDIYDLFCGVLYALKSGCQWRMLPSDFPKWRSVYDYFVKWSKKPSPNKKSTLELCLKKMSWRVSKESSSQR